MEIDNKINDVTDTAIWIAAYRAEEDSRKDSLFKDPYASILINENGKRIATRTQGSRYTAWSVVIRTYIIDKFIQKLLMDDIDTVINLGAGLDTRPYRLELNKKINWIEVDLPKIIELKNIKLMEFSPKCNLERHAIDLSDHVKRDDFLNKIATKSKRAIIITEGVIPYLSNEEARSLADSLSKFIEFKYWITEYYSPEILNFLRTPKRLKQMINAPFLFYPDNWFNFFKDSNWFELETKYFGIESDIIGRTPPIPGWLKNESNNFHKKNEIKKYLGYTIYGRERVINN